LPLNPYLPMTTQPISASIAVLPFVNRSADPNNEYFSDGITEEIINALTKINGLKVTARTSAFAYKNKPADIRKIGQQLGVANIHLTLLGLAYESGFNFKTVFNACFKKSTGMTPRAWVKSQQQV